MEVAKNVIPQDRCSSPLDNKDAEHGSDKDNVNEITSGPKEEVNCSPGLTGPYN